MIGRVVGSIKPLQHEFDERQVTTYLSLIHKRKKPGVSTKVINSLLFSINVERHRPHPVVNKVLVSFESGGSFFLVGVNSTKLKGPQIGVSEALYKRMVRLVRRSASYSIRGSDGTYWYQIPLSISQCKITLPQVKREKRHSLTLHHSCTAVTRSGSKSRVLELIVSQTTSRCSATLA